MKRFRTGEIQILVATDVAARGLDVNNLTHVINYSLPDDAEVYTHRSGRTGRAGNKGTSIVIINMRERRKIQDIERKSGVRFTHEQAPSGKDICKKQLFALIDKVHNVKVDHEQIEPFLSDIYEKLGGLSREDLIQHFVSAEFNRFLDYYKSARDINVTSGSRDSYSSGDRSSGGSFKTLKINLGTSHRFDAKCLLGLINTSMGSSDTSVGKISIKSAFSVFDVQADRANEVMKALIGKTHNGTSILVKP